VNWNVICFRREPGMHFLTLYCCLPKFDHKIVKPPGFNVSQARPPSFHTAYQILPPKYKIQYSGFDDNQTTTFLLYVTRCHDSTRIWTDNCLLLHPGKLLRFVAHRQYSILNSTNILQIYIVSALI
jgi:hypothetical protein